MAALAWVLFLFSMTLPDFSLQIKNNGSNYKKGNRVIGKPRCAARLEDVMRSMRQHGSILELTGYSLHQELRSAPYEMYVTDMRIRGLPRFRVERCAFHNSNTTLDSQILFEDLTVSGTVKLYEMNADPLPHLAEHCNMTIRIRRTPLQLMMRSKHPNFPPRSPNEVESLSKFVNTDFLNFYGCRPTMQHRGLDEPDLSREMETMFLRGVRSLLEAYMEKQVHTALLETFMTYLGYSVSYGRR